MSDSEEEVVLAQEVTPGSLEAKVGSNHKMNTQHAVSTSLQSNQPGKLNSATNGQLTDSPASQPCVSPAGPDSHSSDVTQASSAATLSPDSQATDCQIPCGDHSTGQETPILSSGIEVGESVLPDQSCRPSTTHTSTAASSTPVFHSTPTPVNQRFPNQLTQDFSRDRQGSRQRGGRGGGGGGEEEEDSDGWEELREDRMGNVAGSILGYSPLIYDNTEEGDPAELEELYVPITGYEVMEQRSKFTVFKLNVKKSPNEGYFIFRRYTDFTRLNSKLKILFPGFRLSLPPKRWFGNNFDPIFLEDRTLGLQAFINNITGHKDVRTSGPVREFLCLNDPPGPHDSLEESRVMVDNLEELVYNLRRDVAERDRMLKKKDDEISRLKARLQELQNPELPLETERVGTDQESESSTVEGDRRSCVEADLMDHGIPDGHDEGTPETTDSPLKVSIETLGKVPVKCGGMNGDREVVAVAISQSVTPAGGESR
ncbi:uncharacterized protein [Diadema antillarum]|uniref:uncharacterized protein n=1 Tax=Diadema antillarum TaxID=105358 RepID=UPI003A8ADEF8